VTPELAGKVAAARQRLPLQTVMEQRGKRPSNGNWKAFPKCPYCGKDSAGLFEKAGRQRFKCHHTSCPSGTAGEGGAWDEVGFLAYELGLNRKEAFLTWLKEAGIELAAPKRNGESRRSEYLPSEDEQFDDLPPEAWADPPGPPSTGNPAESAVADSAATDGPSYLRSVDGSAAVPDPPPVAVGVNASPAASAGEPTPPPGEASLSLAEGSPGATGTGPQAQDAAPPATPAPANAEAVQTPASPPPEDAETEPEEESEQIAPTVLAYRWFHEKLELNGADVAALRAKRGLLPRICAELGLRSSPRSNEKWLRQMPDLFPVNVLLDAGLWVRGDGPKDEPRPNLQYCGWGVSGKRKGPDGADEEIWDWTHPVLIPYLNKAGEVMDLRPHKRTQKWQHPRLYVPRRLAGISGEPWKEPAFAIITEGEFKAGAIYRSLRAQGIMAALPGITLSKLLWGELVDWLRDELAYGRPVVVVFDNEDKATPGLPGYKAETWKRHDSALWGRYLAQRLAREGFPARAGTLPNGWRDANGKADWDGALAKLLAA